MSTLLKGKELRLITLGNEVTKDAVCTADDDLFTVYGLVEVTRMYAEVTGVGDGGASTIAINEKTDSIAIAAATTVTSDAVGTLYVVTGQPDAILNGGIAPTIKIAGCGMATAGAVWTPATGHMIWNGGSTGITIEQTQTGADATLTLTWHLFYIPLEEGAYIEAAA